MSVAIEDLRTVRFLAPLKDRDLRRIAGRMSVRTVSAGEELTTQGQGGIAFFILLDGEATVTVDEHELRTLGPGEHFGEIALVLPDLARTATVRAKTDVRVGAMAAWNFRAFVDEHPEVVWPLLETLAERVAGTARRVAAGHPRAGAGR
jgi:cGMP-dependent protein kinase